MPSRHHPCSSRSLKPVSTNKRLSSFGGGNIDYVHESLNFLVRDVIMSAHPHATPKNPAVLAVTVRSPSLMVDYLTPNTDFVSDVMSGLVPYTKYYAKHKTVTDLMYDIDIEAAAESLFPIGLAQRSEEHTSELQSP